MQSNSDVRKYLKIDDDRPVELRICHIANLWYKKVLSKRMKNHLDTIYNLFPNLVIVEGHRSDDSDNLTPEYDFTTNYITAYKKDGYLNQGAGDVVPPIINCLYGSVKSPKLTGYANDIQKRVSSELCRDISLLSNLRKYYTRLILDLSPNQLDNFKNVFKAYINAVMVDLGKNPSYKTPLFPFSSDRLIIDLNNYLAKEFDSGNYADFFMWMNLGALLRNEINGLMNTYDSSFNLRKVAGITTGNLIGKLKERLEYEKANHPSFRLMYEASGFDKDLLPKGYLQIPVSRRMAQADDTGSNEVDSPVISELAEFIKESWSVGKQKHITIEGEGGIGKTVALLSLSSEPGVFPDDVPVIYVPLHRLNSMRYEEGQGMNRLDWFIRSYLKDGCRCSEEETAAFYKLCDHDIEGCFQVVLLLDGYNEVLDSLKGQVKTAIIEWADRPGVQIVTTSRTAWSCGDDFMKIKLQPLSQDAIRGYLDCAGAKIPAPGDNLWMIISFPMMLTLYAHIDIIQKHMDTGMFPEEMDMGHLIWHHMNKAGDIIWNYLQTELARSAQASGGRPDINYGDYAVAILHTAPYIAWKMSRSGYYYIPFEEEDDIEASMESVSFMDLVIESITYLKESGEWVAQLKNIVSSRDKRRWRKLASSPDSEECLDRADRIGNILLKDINLFRRQERYDSGSAAGTSRTSMVCMMHQQFRDGLAAVWLCQRIETMEKDADAAEGIYSRTGDSFALPTCWREDLGRYVLKFTAEIMDNALASRLWEAGRVYQPSHVKYAYIMLNFMSERSIEDGKHQNDFSGLNFSGMDLRDISLYPYKKEGSLKLRLPGKGDEGRMEQTKISTATFQPIGHNGAIRKTSISEDGKRAVSCGAFDKSNRILVWDLETMTCEKVLEGHNDTVESVSISGDGKRAVSLVSSGLYVWNLENMICEKVLAGSLPQSGLDDISISGDGKRAVSFGRYDESNSIFVWNLENMTCEKVLGGHDDDVTCVSISGNGKRAVSGDAEGYMYVWNLETMLCEMTLKVDEYTMEGVSVSNNGMHVISAGWSSGVRIWDLHELKYKNVLEASLDKIKSVSISRDGKHAICGGENRKAYYCDLEKWTCKKVADSYRHDNQWHVYSVNSVSISSNGKRGVFGWNDGGIQVFDFESMTCEKILEGHDYFISRVVTSGDGKCAISGAGDGSVRVWNLDSLACEAVLEGHTSFINGISITSDGKRAISSAIYEKNIRVWNLENMTCEKVLEGHERNANCVSITGDGKRAISSDRHDIFVWNLENMTCEKVLGGYADFVDSLSIDSNGTHAVSVNRGSSYGTCIYFWDLEKYICKKLLVHQQNLAENGLISGDGKLFASVCVDLNAELYGDIFVWNMESYRVEKVLSEPKFNALASVTMSGDGKRVIVIDTPQPCPMTLTNSKGEQIVVMNRQSSKYIYVWNIESIRCQKVRADYDECAANISVSDDGKRAVSCGLSEKNIFLWNLEKMTCEKRIHVLVGIDIVGLDLSGAIFSSEDTREILRQNGAII